MEIDFDALLAGFRDAKEEKTFKKKAVSDYVMSRIYEPLLRNEEVLYANLDFTRFDADDLWELMRLLEDSMKMTWKLADLNRVFCQAKPASVGCRAFC